MEILYLITLSYVSFSFFLVIKHNPTVYVDDGAVLLYNIYYRG